MQKTTQSYGANRTPPPLDTPFARAAQQWDGRMGYALSHAKMWRTVAIVAMLLSVCLAAGLVYAASRQQVEMFVVEVDPARAQAMGVQLSGRQYTPDNSAKAYFVAEAIRLARSRPLDKVVLSENWKRLYAFLAGNAKTEMDIFARENSGLDAKTARQIEISSVLQRSDDSYQVRWIESTYQAGRLREREAWTGLFTVAHVPPTDKMAILTNPVGLYVTEFEWGRDFASPAPRASRTPTTNNTQSPRRHQ